MSTTPVPASTPNYYGWYALADAIVTLVVIAALCHFKPEYYQVACYATAGLGSLILFIFLHKYCSPISFIEGGRSTANMKYSEEATALFFPFYQNKQPNLRKDPRYPRRFISEIIKYNMEQLEIEHDYVQWVFPLLEGSGATNTAPSFTKENAENLLDDDDAFDYLKEMYNKMLTFFGLSMTLAEGGVLVVNKGKNWLERRDNWMHINTHNFPRLDRMIRFLCYAGFKSEAQALFNFLQALLTDENEPHRGNLTHSYTKYWTNAIQTQPLIKPRFRSLLQSGQV